MTNDGAVLVTGSARGIGRATAELFAERGYRIAITDIQGEEAAEAAREIDPSGDRAIGLEMDVTDSASVNKGMEDVVGKFGGLSVLVNNAGTVNPQPSADIPDEDWEALVNVHLGGAFRCCRAAYPALRDSGHGAIVSISSVAAKQGIPKRLSYSASKAGIEGLTKVLAVEWAAENIRVNAVGPGYTMTKRMEGTIASGLLEEQSVTRLIPLERFARPREISEAVFWLASERASYVTGQTLYADGGVTVNSNW
jgi:NAD(P)-dependent dehydrogenase (short-subunit alcohol dehydrogenase family)